MSNLIDLGNHWSEMAKLRRLIPKESLFDLADWQRFYKVSLNKGKLTNIPKFPWSEEELNQPCPFFKDKKILETHFAFLGLDAVNGAPLNIMKWKSLEPNFAKGFNSQYANSWCNTQNFAAKTTCEFGWYLIMPEIISWSCGRSYKQQLLKLPYGYIIPSAIEEITKNFLVFKKQRRHPNRLCWAKCRDLMDNFDSEEEMNIIVGCAGPNGMAIDHSWKGDTNIRIGIGAARLPTLKKEAR